MITTSYQPTAEQQEAVRLFATGASLAIEAGAGTGKTSTLIAIAESTTRRGQYVAFNRSIVDDAKVKMPANVNASTAHSLAFRAVGVRYKHRLPTVRMRGDEIARRLRIDPLTIKVGDDNRRLSPGYLAGLVIKASRNFSHSADKQISVEHVPYIDGIDLPTGDRRGWANNREVRRFLAPALAAAWADLASPSGILPFTHDCYLKIFELSGPVIPVDFILFDESQDADPVMLSIVQQQKCQLVFVGDSQQQIYDWRGAINALSGLGGSRCFLTNSFRFGPVIADIANSILSRIPDAELRLTGRAPYESTFGASDDPRAYLTRTNAGAIDFALKETARGRKVHLMGGGKEIASFCRAALDLQVDPPRRTEHPELACFASWKEVEDYADLDPNGDELRLMVKIINQYGATTILALLDGTVSEDKADVIVSTAHKAKGREWDVVRLGSDFSAPKEGDAPSASELRLLYVAATRARHHLDGSICGALIYLLDEADKEPEQDEPDADLIQGPVRVVEPICSACKAPLARENRPGEECPICRTVAS
jgi:hypothetical protein